MAEIKTIFWDIGGVLLTNGWDASQRAHVLPRFGIDLAEYEKRHESANYLWERGLSTAREYFDKTVFYEPRSFTFADLWPHVKAESRVLHPECFDILAALAATGWYNLATLNNESRELNEHRLEAFELKQYFSLFVCSGYVREMKPHPDIYCTALELIQVPPASTLFIDDRAANTAPAAALGMNTITFTTPSQLRASLAALGVHAGSS